MTGNRARSCLISQDEIMTMYTLKENRKKRTKKKKKDENKKRDREIISNFKW